MINDECQNTSRYSSSEEAEWNEPNENDLQVNFIKFSLDRKGETVLSLTVVNQ